MAALGGVDMFGAGPQDARTGVLMSFGADAPSLEEAVRFNAVGLRLGFAGVGGCAGESGDAAASQLAPCAQQWARMGAFVP